MSDLSGSLACFGLIPLSRFIAEQGKSGTLLVSQAGWLGTLAFDGGQLSAAICETQCGPSALRVMLEDLSGGQFQFTEGEPGLEPNLGADPWGEVGEPSDTGVPLNLPGPTRVPRLLQPLNLDDEAQEVQLCRGDLAILLDIDGQRTVRELAARHGLSGVVRALLHLQLAGLVELGTTRAVPAPMPPPEPTDILSAEPVTATARQSLGDGPAGHDLAEVVGPPSPAAAPA